MMTASAMITTTTVARFSSTLPSVRVRCTTRAACTGEAIRAWVSSVPCRFFTPSTTRSTTPLIVRRRTARTMIATTIVTTMTIGMRHTVTNSVKLFEIHFEVSSVPAANNIIRTMLEGGALASREEHRDPARQRSVPAAQASAAWTRSARSVPARFSVTMRRSRRLRVRVEPGPSGVPQLDRGERRRVEPGDDRVGHVVAALGPDAGEDVEVLRHEALEHDRAVDVLVPDRGLADDRVRQRVRVDERRERGELALGRRDRRAGAGSGLLAGRGLVRRELGVDVDPSAAPASTRPSSSSQRRSVSTSSPSSATEPSRSPRRVATCSGVDGICAKNFTNWNCASEPASASVARVHSVSPTCRIVASDRAGAT